MFGQLGSPYLRLLHWAGCESGDLRRLIEQEGCEGALTALYRRGVYLTVDEYKGRQPVVRGSSSFPLAPADLANPTVRHVLVGVSSGSRGGGTPYGVSLEFLRDRGYTRCFQLDALGGRNWRKAQWGVPGGSSIDQMLQYSLCGRPPERWFSQVDPLAPGLHARYRWSVQLMRLGAVLGGVRLPAPEYVSLDDPLPIVSWMEQVLRNGETPFLHTFTSAAVRVCRAAEQAGVDLRGACFALGGEPTTAARLAAVARVGGRAIPNYAFGESGRVGLGCLAPIAPDDLHVISDLVALIQPGDDPGDDRLPPRALLVTSLRPRAPLVLLNVSPGDQADLSRRACGCPFDEMGYPLHLSALRSFEKLTAGGMTFHDFDIIQVLEEVLPTRFGGGPIDYQLVEQEDHDGLPRLYLLAHPRLGPLDEGDLRETFLRAIGQGEGRERIMALQWRQGELLRVRREPPRATANGKILHLRQEGRARAQASTARVGAL